MSAELIDCSEKINKDSCSYYLCAEENRKCGNSGYLLGFGYTICQKFLTMDTSSYTDQGKKWLSDVRYELQKSVENIPIQYDCEQLRKAAFEVHVPVYRKTGFCKLNPLDRYQIYYSLRGVLLNPETIINGFNIIESCVEDRGGWYFFSSDQNYDGNEKNTDEER